MAWGEHLVRQGKARQEIHLEGSSQRTDMAVRGRIASGHTYPLITEGSWAQGSCLGREATHSHCKGLHPPTAACLASPPPATRRAGKSCCSGSLHFPNKTALAAKWSWLPGWVQSQAHFSLPISSECNLTSSLLDSFRPCNWWIEATRREVEWGWGCR